MKHSEYQLARTIADIAHRGQMRKDLGPDAGKSYIVHPLRVAAALATAGAHYGLVSAAWLHDVIEDTPWTADDLRDLGISDETVALVVAVSRVDGETYFDFIDRVVAAGPDAVKLKIADIEDNRAGLPNDHGLHKRYAKALAILKGGS